MFNEKAEAMKLKVRQEKQLEALKDLVKKTYSNIPFYKKKFDEAGLKPSDIKTLKDIEKIPFTTKDNIRENYPFSLFCTDMKDIVEIHTSSGTTGKPIVAGYTKNDIEIWKEVMARALSCAGVTQKDVIQNAYGYGLFTGGLGIHYGGQKIGATVIPISGGNTKRQLMIMKDFKTTILTCTPSYTLYLAEVAKEDGYDMAKMNIKAGVFGAEPWSETMRKEIEKKLNLKAYDIYGMTEIIGPGVANECGHQSGLHIFDDYFYPEIIDPKSGKTLKPGEKGELVITTLFREGTPLLRYRTRDITVLNTEICKCGRTHPRMMRVLGRTDDMLIIRGVNVFPSQIEEALLKIKDVEPHYQIIVNRVEHLDELELQVEVSGRIFSDEIKKLEEIEKNIKKDIESTIGISVKVKLVEPKTITRSEGKAKRVIDNRKI